MKYTVSCTQKKEYSLAHDLREEEMMKAEEKNERARKAAVGDDSPFHVHKELTPDNETWVRGEPISMKGAFEDCFGKAVADYNSAQTRDDRKIDDYYQKCLGRVLRSREAAEKRVKAGKKPGPVFTLAKEMIIAVGSKDRPFPDKEKAREIMKEYCETFEERNPNMHVVGAFYHQDEDGVPHVHLLYIPFAYSDKGLRKELSASRAYCQTLNARGIKIKTPNAPKGTEWNEKLASHRSAAVAAWNEEERRELENICNRYEVEIFHPVRQALQKAREAGDADREASLQHRELGDYKRLKRRQERQAKDLQDEYDKEVQKVKDAEAERVTKWEKDEKKHLAELDKANENWRKEQLEIMELSNKTTVANEVDKAIKADADGTHRELKIAKRLLDDAGLMSLFEREVKKTERSEPVQSSVKRTDEKPEKPKKRGGLFKRRDDHGDERSR